MARLANAVDSTARASVPGARKSTASPSIGSTSTSEKNTSSRHRDAEREQQRLAVAQGQRQLEAHLGEQRPHVPSSSSRPDPATRGRVSGVGRGVRPVSRRKTSSRRWRPARRSASGEVVLGQPGGEGGDGGRASAAPPTDVLAGRDLGHGDAAEVARRAPATSRPAGRRNRTLVAAAGAAVSSASVPSATSRPSVDDHDAVGDALGLVEVVGGEQHGRRRRRAARRRPARMTWRPAGSTPGGRLVEERHLGPADERQGQGEPLLLAARQLAPGPALGPAQARPARAAPAGSSGRRVERGGEAQQPRAPGPPGGRRPPAASRRCGRSAPRGRRAGRARAPTAGPAAGRRSPRASRWSRSCRRRSARAARDLARPRRVNDSPSTATTSP